MTKKMEISDFCHALMALKLRAPIHRFWVALSGGADSTALAYAFAEASHWFTQELGVDRAPLWGIHHVNYGLRGAESDGDEEFCKALAALWEVPCLITKAPAAPASGIQAWAREIRREQWNILQRQGDAVALGHHLDDVTENIILRMARGTSAGRLTGFREWSPPLWRPFLEYRKADILHWLEARGASFRQDSSNDKIDYARNKIRHQILPLLEQMFPGSTARIAHLGFSIETQDMENKQLQKSLPSQLTDELYQYCQRTGQPFPQISKRWIEESQKIFRKTSAGPFVAVPQSPTARGPFQAIVRVTKDGFSIGHVRQERYKKKRFAQMSPGLSPPPLYAKLPARAKFYRTGSELSQDGSHIDYVATLVNTQEESHFVSIEPALAKVPIIALIQTKKLRGTCKDFFQSQKIDPKVRCRWRVIKYDGNVISLSDGKRALVLLEKNQSLSGVIQNVARSQDPLIDASKIKTMGRGEDREAEGRGVYWIC